MTKTCITLKRPAIRLGNGLADICFCVLACGLVFFRDYLTDRAEILLYGAILMLPIVMTLIQGSVKSNALWLVWVPYFFLAAAELPFSHNAIFTMKALAVNLALWVSAYFYTNYRLRKDILPRILFALSGVYTTSVILQLLFPGLVSAFQSRLMSPESYESFLLQYKSGYFSGITSEVGVVAYYCVIFAAFNFCGALFEDRSKWKRYLFIGVSVLALMLTKKRAHFLGFLLVVAVIITYKEGIRAFKKMLAAGIALAALLFVLSFIPETQAIIERIIEGGLSGRESIYAILLNRFRENPITGIGLSCSTIYISKSLNLGTAHNEYLRALCETGILGFLAFIFALLYAYVHTLLRFRRVLRSKSYVPESELSLIAFSLFMQTFTLMYAMTGNPLSESDQLYMYFLCVALGNRRISKAQSILPAF